MAAKTFVIRIVSSMGRDSDKYADNASILSAMMDVSGYSGIIRARSDKAQYIGANCYGHTVYCVYKGYTSKATLLKAIRQTIGKHYGEWGTSWADDYNYWSQDTYNRSAYEI